MACCEHCVNKLGFGPRLKRIVLYLVQHAADWERDPSLEVVRFKIVAGEPERVSYRIEHRETIESVG